MIPKKQKKISGWMAIAFFLAIPIPVISIDAWWPAMLDLPFLRNFSNMQFTIVCSISGMAAWLFYVVDNFRKHIVARLLAGLIAGAGSFWFFGGYLTARGGESLFRIELVLAFLPGFALGMLVYYLITKDKTMFNNFNNV